MRKLILLATIGFLIGGCETISEESCMSGSWQDIGFNDGETGASRSRFAKITETCAKYGITPDRSLYFAGYDEGLIRYCTPDRGYEAGARGNEAHSECRAGGFTDYMDAHADGLDYYAFVSHRDNLIEQWKDLDRSVVDIEARLQAEDLTDRERDTLLKDLAQIKNEMDELRVDIRVYERLNGLPEWSPY